MNRGHEWVSAARFDAIADLTRPENLSQLFGPVRRVEVRPLRTIGYSGSRHFRLDVGTTGRGPISLVLKEVNVRDDWIALRSGDTVGREAALLAEPAASGVWQVLDCPYLAYAIEDGRIGLLMRDLGAGLFPDVDEPITIEHEGAILDALAGLHARYWESADLGADWLATPAGYYEFLGPGLLDPPLARLRRHSRPSKPLL